MIALNQSVKTTNLSENSDGVLLSLNGHLSCPLKYFTRAVPSSSPDIHLSKLPHIAPPPWSKHNIYTLLITEHRSPSEHFNKSIDEF